MAWDWLRQTRTDGEVSALLDSWSCLPVTAVIGNRAGALRRQFRHSHNGIRMIDHLVAATAEVHGCALATLNIKHFPMFDGLQAPFELRLNRGPA